MKKNKTKKQMCTAGIIALILVAIDQLTKYLAVINLKQSSTGVFVLIPGVFEFRYLENQSAAFGAVSYTHLTDISGTLTQSQWDAIHQGMRMVVEDLHDVFGGFTGVEVSGKTGTAQQVETRPNHALFVGYAPSSNPEITIATRISYGYSSHNAAAASRNIISYYYNLESLDDLLAVKAEGVKSSGSSARTD